MPLTQRLLLTLALLAGVAASAQEAAVVEALQAPAWVERRGARAPLKPGMYLEVGDRLRTGAGSRVLLRLSEGSHLRLGEQARFRLATLSPPPQPGGPFTGRLELESGALRFTTSVLSGLHRRSLEVQVGTLTATLDGTDLWARAGTEQGVLCLIEGAVTVRRDGAPPQPMAEPLTFVEALPGGAAPRVATMDPRRLAGWVQETALAPGSGILRGNGPWRVTLASFRTRERAATALRALHAAGYPAEIVGAPVRDETWFRVVMDGFAAHGEAQAFARAMDGRYRIRRPWVSPLASGSGSDGSPATRTK